MAIGLAILILQNLSFLVRLFSILTFVCKREEILNCTDVSVGIDINKEVFVC